MGTAVVAAPTVTGTEEVEDDDNGDVCVSGCVDGGPGGAALGFEGTYLGVSFNAAATAAACAATLPMRSVRVGDDALASAGVASGLP